MKKFFLTICAMLAVCFSCYSSAEASSAESNVSIIFDEEEVNGNEIGTGDENTVVDEAESNQMQGTLPKTGDASSMKFIILGYASLAVLSILMVGKRKRES